MSYASRRSAGPAGQAILFVVGLASSAGAMQAASSSPVSGPLSPAVPRQPSVAFATSAQDIGEGAGPTGIPVLLSSASAAPVTVHYSVRGTALDPDDYSIAPSPLVIPAGELSGDIILVPVDEMVIDPGETVVITLRAATNAGLGQRLIHTATLGDNDVLVSDDFNQCSLDPIWALTDPVGDAVLTTRGAGSADAQLLLSIPPGTHDLFDTTFTVPTVTQAIPDADFEMEVKFDSLVIGSVRDQGVLVLEDELNWVRFDFYSSADTLRLFAASTVAGTSTQRLNLSLGMAVAPMWLRVDRTGDQWTLSSSVDGMTFSEATSFSFALAPMEAGVYAGNSGPGHTMIVDYVFETASPIVPEDGAVIGEIGYSLTIGVEGNGSVTRTPDLPLYYCMEDVTLTAVPDPGWLFDRWEMDLGGTANPGTIGMGDNRSVTAVFVLAARANRIRDAGVGPAPE